MDSLIREGTKSLVPHSTCFTDGLTQTKPHLRSSSTDPRSGFTDGENNIFIKNNGYQQSWLDDDDIIVSAIFPENFRCIIFSPSECCNTFLLKELIIINISFD